MKKGLFVLLIAVLAASVGVTAFAASKEGTRTETVTCPAEESQTAEEKEAAVGDETSVEGLKIKCAIDNTYRENVEDFNGYTNYYYTKIDRNGIANPYDALSIMVDNETGEIFTYKRFDRPAFLEAKIDEAAAKDAAVKAHPRYGKEKDYPIEKCVLEYYMPGYPEGDICLAYRVEFEDGNVIYVNAESGGVAGTDQFK